MLNTNLSKYEPRERERERENSQMMKTSNGVDLTLEIGNQYINQLTL